MKKEISVEVKGKEWEEALNKALKKAIKKVKIDGFRQGHVPEDVFLKKYGKESLYMDASEECLHESYHKVIDENKDLEIVAEPQVDIKEVNEKGVTFVFKFILKPEVKLGKYTELGVKKETVKVTKKEIDDQIEHMRSHYAENVLKDGPIKNGDIAIIDFEGFKDGVAFKGGKGENYSLEIGSKTFIPGFEEQLIGLKANDEKDIEVTFPEDYHSEELKGAKVTFKVKVHEVKEVQIPELNEDFFEDLGIENVNSKEALEDYVKNNIKAQKDHEVEEKYIDALLEAASKNVKVDIPDEMIDEETKHMLKEYEEHLKTQGISLEMFYKYTNSDESALKAQMKDEAVKRITYRLMLEEIIKKEKIEVTEEEANKEAEEMAKKYGVTKDELLKNFGGIEMLIYDMKMRKTIDILKK